MAKRLHAFAEIGLVAIFALVSLASCKKEKPATVAPALSAPPPAAAASVESTVQGKPMQIIDLEKVTDSPIVDINSYIGSIGLGEYGDFVVGNDYLTAGNGYVIMYDETQNAFVIKYKLMQSEERIQGAEGIYYLAAAKLYRYGEMIAPNTALSIYPLGDLYFSVYLNRKSHDYSIISTSDLVNWKLTRITTQVPILIYREDSDLFAIADNEVFRLRDGNLVPWVPEYRLNSRDTVIFSYAMKGAVVVNYQRAFDDGPRRYFLTINLSDFSCRQTDADSVLDASGYTSRRAIERADGWKVYLVAKDPRSGVKVLDPLAPGGPAFVESLPGVAVK